MPLVRGCRNRHCPDYATGPDGWCDQHRRQPFYSSPPLPPGWEATRARQLAAFPFCACGAPATEVHHVRGRAAGDGPDNLTSLCGRCHRHITAVEAGWLSAP